ncbi:unnamed protein product [Ectocarpus sp. 12 AP-2014]
MKKIIIVLFVAIFGLGSVNAQMSEAGKIGVGVAWTSLNYGVSAKYNFTETHTGQLIVGSANFGFGLAGGSSFALTGRYAYNFTEGDVDFATYKPYLYGQAGYWTYSYNLPQGTDGFTSKSIVIGAGGGIEGSFKNFVDGLAFSVELGYTNVAFDGLSSIGGFNFGGGIHYYFQ